MAGIAAALDGGADVNEIAGLVSPLYIATINSKLEAVKLLIKRGADVSLSTKFGSPLHAAAQTGCLDCVKLLVEAGADVNALTPERKPPIHLAKKFGYSEVADYLVMHGYVIPYHLSYRRSSTALTPSRARSCSWENAQVATMPRRKCVLAEGHIFGMSWDGLKHQSRH